MVIPVQFESIEEIRAIQRLACAADEDVFLHSPDNAIMVDAKSFIGLFTLDFSKPVRFSTDKNGRLPTGADVHFLFLSPIVRQRPPPVILRLPGGQGQTLHGRKDLFPQVRVLL